MALEARLRLPLAGPTPAAAFLSGSSPPGTTHLSFPLRPTPTPTSLSTAAAANAPPPIVVVGSANADIYVEVHRLPLAGETVAARAGRSLAGGKGANQAACAGRLSSGPVYLVARVGDDANGRLLEGALADAGGVRLDRLARVPGVPSGHAVVMLMPDGQNSIIIVGGANMQGWNPDLVGKEDLDLVRQAGAVLLQREIPDVVNFQVAKAARMADVPVIMDAGGMDAPFSGTLLWTVDIFSPNETELARATGMPTETFEQISEAAAECHNMGAKQVLVKLGSQGSALFIEGEEPIRQPIIPATEVVDTTGAGDTFTAAFAVAMVEGKPKKECMRFAAAAASLCVRVKGAIPSMPDRESVMNLLESAQAQGL